MSNTPTAYFQDADGEWTPLGVISDDGVQIEPKDTPTDPDTTARHHLQADHYRLGLTVTPPPKVETRVRYDYRTHQYDIWRDGVHQGRYNPEELDLKKLRHIANLHGIYRLPGDPPLLHNGRKPRK